MHLKVQVCGILSILSIFTVLDVDLLLSYCHYERLWLFHYPLLCGSNCSVFVTTDELHQLYKTGSRPPQLNWSATKLYIYSYIEYILKANTMLYSSYVHTLNMLAFQSHTKGSRHHKLLHDVPASFSFKNTVNYLTLHEAQLFALVVNIT